MSVCYNKIMKAKLVIKKLYPKMSESDLKKQSAGRMVFCIASTVCALALLVIPQKGYDVMMNEHYLYASVIILISVATAASAIFCLAGHFTLYKLRTEYFERQLPALKGNWHTYAAMEIQLVMFAAMTVAEAAVAYFWPHVLTFVALAVAGLGTVCAWFVRSITFNAMKDMSDEPYKEKITGVSVNEEVEEFYREEE